jgi:hypothetical protein
MPGKSIGRRALLRMGRKVASEDLVPDTTGITNVVGLTRRGSGHDSLRDLADQQQDREKG